MFISLSDWYFLFDDLRNGVRRDVEGLMKKNYSNMTSVDTSTIVMLLIMLGCFVMLTMLICRRQRIDVSRRGQRQQQEQEQDDGFDRLEMENL